MKATLKFYIAIALSGLLSAPALMVQAQTPDTNCSSKYMTSAFAKPGVTIPPSGDAGSTAVDRLNAQSSPVVSKTVTVAPHPSTVTAHTRDTQTASLLNVATLPPNRPVSKEAAPVPLRSVTPVQSDYAQPSAHANENNPVQTAQTAPSHMNKQKITPSDPPDMLKSKLGYDGWGQILKSYATIADDGLVRFDYAALAASPKDMKSLNSYIDDLADKKPSTFSREQAMVYWANMYNALTVKVVAENYPVSSIRKIKSGWRAGPWRRDLIEVEGETLTLDNIEHDIMRPTFNTPLVHYMVNCASIGCPNLKSTPWQVATLDADLDAAARAYINSPRGVTIDRGRLKVSSIYNWFAEDFGSDHPSIIAHLSKYADEDLSPKLIGRKKIDKYGYDWDVNAP